MNPEAAKRLRLLASAISILLLLAVLAVGWFYWKVRSSLPQLDGAATVGGLTAAVTVERDALGVPTIRGESRIDVSRALGWLHGQERFFQMDLLRRMAAGELAEVFGKRALPRDRATRMHGFRKLAQSIVPRLNADERAVVEAYTTGVNAGLGALRERPFEYLVLRDQPAPWRVEDCILIIYAMTLDLQDEEGIYERTLMTLRDKLGVESLAFFAPVVTPTDAALDGTTAPIAPVPEPKVINLRARKVGEIDNRRDSGRWPATSGRRLAAPAAETRPPFRQAQGPEPVEGEVAFHLDPFPFSPRDPDAMPGSNAFALGGAHTASGSALVANDPHLNHGVPNTWYRASLDYPSPANAAGGAGRRKVTGVTLPGAPAVVAGSNGSVAWGFTNSQIDTGDLVIVEVNSIAQSLYKAPDRDGLIEIERRKESILVKGEPPIVAEYSWTVWGPIVGTNERQQPLALRWVAHDPEAANFTLLEMENATNVTEGVAVAHRAGVPAQNILLGDTAGAIAWTIAGRIPKRVGFDGRLPVTWSFGDRKWDGLLPADEVPVVLGDASTMPGRLWSANNRHVGGEALAKLGDGAYNRAPRATQIRDDLAPLERATPKDLFAVQLDDRALFLTPWHKLLMDTLTPAVTAEKKPRAALRSFAEKWEGRASVDAVSYRLVREFRTAVHGRVFPPIFAPCVEAFPGFNSHDLQLEGALWTMLREKPAHLLSPEFATWDELLVAAIDDTIKAIDKSGVALPQGNWGWRNRVRIRHPFSNSFPWLAQWINMPADPLPGDNDMPRVQTPIHGASERMVVSPGHENEGIFHMPCGQSGHPMSPYFRAGHDAWVRGEPLPLLPGKSEHTLTLRP